MADLVAFDFPTTDSAAALRYARTQLNRQGFIERSLQTQFSDRPEFGRDYGYFQRSSTTTFESHYPLGMVNNVAALSTVATAVNTFVAVPFVADAYTKDLLEFEVTTGAGAGGKARVGIYGATDDLNGTPYPANLVQQSSEFDVTSTGVKSTSVTLTLDPGRLYFAAYLCGTNAPTVRAIPLTNVYPFFGLPSTLGTAPQYGYTVASTYSSTGLPASYPTGATAVTAAALPAAFFRSAGVATVTRYLQVFSPSVAGYFLRRVKLLSSSATSLSSASSYVKVEPSIRTTDGSSVLGTFDSRSNRLAAGTPYYVVGPQEADVNLAVDSQYEVKVTFVGVCYSIRDMALQTDIAFSGATS